MPTPKAEFELAAKNKMAAAFEQADKQFAGIEKAASRMSKAVRVAVGAFAGNQIVNFVRNSLDAVATLDDAANAAGVTAERLQELQFAFGKLAGVTDDQVNQTLRRFNVALGQASTGSGPAVGAFRELGVSLLDAGGHTRKTVDVLNDAIGALAGVQDPARRAAEASALFGEDSGPKLAAALNSGIAAIAEQTQRARDLGLVYANDVVAGAGNASDAIEDLYKQLSHQASQLVVENANAIEGLATSLSHVVSFGSRAATGLGEFFGKLVTGVDLSDSELEQLDTRIKKVQKSLDELTRQEEVAGLPHALDKQQAALQKQLDLLEWERKQLLKAQQNPSLAGAVRPAPPSPAAVPAPAPSPVVDAIAEQQKQGKDREQLLKDQLGRELEQVRQFTLTRDQVELEAHQRRLEILRNAFDQGLIDQQRYYGLSVELAKRAQERITQVEGEAANERAGFFESEASSKLATAFQLAGNLIAISEADSKKRFELQKKLSIASAIVNTARAVTEVLPNFGLAARVAAKGLIEIAAIKKQQWHGAGSAVSAGGGAAALAPLAPPPPIQNLSPQRSEGRNQIVVNVNVAGSVLGEGGRARLAEDIAKILQEHVDDRDGVIISANSRQAAIIKG